MCSVSRALEVVRCIIPTEPGYSMLKRPFRNCVFIAAGCLLAVSLVLNAVLLKQLQHSIEQYQTLRLDPLDLQRHRKPVHEPGCSIFMVGDSRAQQWTIPDRHGCRHINLGIGGQTTAQILYRFEHILRDNRPDIVILQAGVNDLRIIGLLPESKNAIVASCSENIREITEAALTCGAAVVLTTVFPIGDPPLPAAVTWPFAVYEAVLTVNKDILSLAGGGVQVLDAFSLLAGSDGRLSPAFGSDFLHLNEAGYRVLNAELVKLLDNIGENV